MSETSHHLVVAAYMDRRGWWWEHVPNGGSRTARSGAAVRRLGARPGSPDFRVYDPPKGYAGTALELKDDKGRASKEQVRFLAELAARNWKTILARGADDAIKQLEEAYGPA